MSTTCDWATSTGKHCVLDPDHRGGHVVPPSVQSRHYWSAPEGLVAFEDRAPEVGVHVEVHTHLLFPTGRVRNSTSAGVYQGVRTDEWDPRREVHYFEGGHINGTRQGCLAFNTTGTHA